MYLFFVDKMNEVGYYVSFFIVANMNRFLSVNCA